MRFSQIQFDSIRAMQLYQVFRQGSMVLLAIFMTKGILTQSEIGQWELLFFIGFASSFFWLDALIKSFLSQKNDLAESRNLGQLYATTMGVMLLVTAIILLGQRSFMPRLLGVEALPYLHYFAIYLLLFAPSAILPPFYVVKNRPQAIFWQAVLTLLGPSICLAIMYFMNGDMSLFYKAMIGFGFIMHLFIWYELYRERASKINFQGAVNLFRVAWPLMIYAIATSLAKVFDGWLVSWTFKDESIFAIFRYGAREFPMTTALTAGMTIALIPLLNQNRTTALAMIKKRSARIMHILVPLIVLLLFASPYLFQWFFNDSFTESSTIFNVYLLLIISQVVFPHTILLADQKNKVILYTALIELAVNVILSIIFIQMWGLIGVAFATVIAFAIEKIIYAAYVYAHYNIAPSRYLAWRIYTFYMIMVVLSFWISWEYVG